jgi:hypothetical protein
MHFGSPGHFTPIWQKLPLSFPWKEAKLTETGGRFAFFLGGGELTQLK